MGGLTTGLARAELALEEARELEVRWPLYSEGCPRSRRRTRRQKQRTGSAERQRAGSARETPPPGYAHSGHSREAATVPRGQRTLELAGRTGQQASVGVRCAHETDPQS